MIIKRCLIGIYFLIRSAASWEEGFQRHPLAKRHRWAPERPWDWSKRRRMSFSFCFSSLHQTKLFFRTREEAVHDRSGR